MTTIHDPRLLPFSFSRNFGLLAQAASGGEGTHANFLMQLFAERLSTNELALFTRQLSSLLEAGLPLEQAFSALREQAERPYMRDLIASIRAEVMGGASLSDALSRHPRDFAEIYRALVASESILVSYPACCRGWLIL